MKIVVNTCYGGFGLSEEAFAEYKTLGGDRESYYDIPRDDPILVDIVERHGTKAGGRFAQLAIVEIPDNVAWEIAKYDGMEHVAEKHRTWYVV